MKKRFLLKITSVKTWVALALIVIVIIFAFIKLQRTFIENVDLSAEYAMLKWIMAGYFTANVGQKITEYLKKNGEEG